MLRTWRGKQKYEKRELEESFGVVKPNEFYPIYREFNEIESGRE